MARLSDIIYQTIREVFDQEDAEKVIKYLNNYGYFTARCCSHDNWRGGLAQHSWRTYQCALQILRDKAAVDSTVLQKVNEKDIARVTLLHDICDTYHNIHNYDWNIGNTSKHGGRSAAIINKFIKVRLTSPQHFAIADHQHGFTSHGTLSPTGREQYKAILEIQQKADHMACGIAWNSTRFKEGRTQHSGSFSANLLPTAMDRTVQTLKYNMYVDCYYNFHTIKGYGRNNIQTNATLKSIGLDENAKLAFDSNADVITATHQLHSTTKEMLCMVIPADTNCPSAETRSPWRSLPQKELFICSNLAFAFFREHKIHHFKFSFTPVDSVQDLYDKCQSGIYLPDVTIMRDGQSEGFRQVAPWKVDILLVKGDSFEPYILKLNEVGQ